jgi:hypothetical protein
MAKAPAFQFYIKDWLSDPQLKMASHASKGIWIDLLCYMWESPKRGELTGTVQEFCRLIGSLESEFSNFLDENNRLNFASVTESNGKVTVQNRRMIRDEKERNNNALRQAKFKSNAKSNAEGNEKVTGTSSTSSPSSKKKENIIKRKIEFSEDKFINIPPALIQKWELIAPAISIASELAKAEAWALSNPKLRKSNWSRFLTNWMIRAQDRAKGNGGNANGGFNPSWRNKGGQQGLSTEQERDADEINRRYYESLKAADKAGRDAYGDDAPDFESGGL